jgi:hypothetical protein
MKEVFVTRRERFNAAHRLFNPSWSDDKNESIFRNSTSKFKFLWSILSVILAFIRSLKTFISITYPVSASTVPFTVTKTS